MQPQFGPPGAKLFADFSLWATAAKARGLILIGCSNGSVAQDGPRGTCRGFWGYGIQRGWLERVEHDDRR